MRAISLWEPWASAIAHGLKKIETRSWPTKYRGPIAIHAAATKSHALFIRDAVVCPLFMRVGIDSQLALSFGCVVATARIAACVRTENLRLDISDDEWSLGNYDDGRYGWMLEDIVRLERPVPARGMQGFWEWNGGAQ